MPIEPEPQKERTFAAFIVVAVASLIVGHALVAAFGGPTVPAIPAPLTTMVALATALAATLGFAAAGRSAARDRIAIVAGAVVGVFGGIAAAKASGAWLAGIGSFVLVGAGCGWALPTLARKLPASLDGAFQRRRGRAIVFILAGLLTVFQSARISTFMSDPTLAAASAIPPDDFFVHHSCFSAYVNAAALLERGVTNPYDAKLYPADPHAPEGTPAPAIALGPLNIDAYEYPPPFLLLPKLGLLFTHDFLRLRTLWYFLEAGSFALVLLLLAQWLGGREGLYAGLLATAVWISIPTQLTFQIGNFHLLAIALSVGGMLAFEKERPGLGGALFGFAIVSKVFPGILLVFLLAQRRWRALGWTALFCVVYTAAALLVFGAAPFAAFVGYQLPRIASGEAFAFFEKNVADVAANQSLYGLVYKLKNLGVPGMTRTLANVVSWIYTLLLLGAAFFAGRRAGDRRGRAMLWLALLNLAALRSPFAPLYVVVSSLWLLSLLSVEIHGRRRRVVGMAVGWVLMSLLPPIPVAAALLLVSMIGQGLSFGVNAWVIARGSAS